MWQIHRALKILKEDGPIQLLKSSISYLTPSDYYNNKIWPLLPSTADYGTYNKVEVKGSHPMKVKNPIGLEIKHKTLDKVVPWQTPSNIPDFKRSNVEQINRHFKKGDKIVIIGGGNGVSAVHAARKVGPDGEVLIYEGDKERILDLKETLKHNQVFGVCEIHHSIVGQAHLVESPGNANIVDPSDLPQCDALEMDCEGAELDVLKNIERLPATVIVELHHKKDFSPYSSAERIEDILKKSGYRIQRYDGPWVNGLIVGSLE